LTLFSIDVLKWLKEYLQRHNALLSKCWHLEYFYGEIIFTPEFTFLYVDIFFCLEKKISFKKKVRDKSLINRIFWFPERKVYKSFLLWRSVILDEWLEENIRSEISFRLQKSLYFYRSRFLLVLIWPIKWFSPINFKN
jgi:hypothetical protein